MTILASDTDPSLATAAARFAVAVRSWTTGTERDTLTRDVTEILSLLAEQTEWRVFVDGTKNLGHQASTVLLLRRLIDLTAFRGYVVVVYADQKSALLGSTADKLALMFVGVDPRRLDDEITSYGPCGAIRFLPLQRASELREAIAFGFTGGADDLAFNAAATLNVRFFLRLQPYLWDDPPVARRDPYYECSRIEQPDGRHLYPLQSWPELRTLAIRPPSSLQYPTESLLWRWYAQQQSFNAELASRMRNALTVLTAQNNGRCLMWPLYGLQHFAPDAANIVLSCSLLSLFIAHQRRRAILLCSFNPSEDSPDWADLAEALSQDLSAREHTLPTVATALARRHTEAVETGRLRPDNFASCTRELGRWLHARCPDTSLLVYRASVNGKQWRKLDESLRPALAGHGNAAVHLVELGPVAMDAFHCFIGNADLPCVIEGQTTANLLTTLGRPFLQLLRRDNAIQSGYATTGDVALDAIADRLTAGARDLRDLALVGARDASPYDLSAYGEQLDRIARLVNDASEAKSTTGRYFRALADHFARPSSDKLFIMLLALREVIMAN